MESFNLEISLTSSSSANRTLFIPSFVLSTATLRSAMESKREARSAKFKDPFISAREFSASWDMGTALFINLRRLLDDAGESKGLSNARRGLINKRRGLAGGELGVLGILELAGGEFGLLGFLARVKTSESWAVLQSKREVRSSSSMDPSMSESLDLGKALFMDTRRLRADPGGSNGLVKERRGGELGVLAGG
jgi:hypothetical protein